MSYQGWFKGRYLRSSYEYIYALYLEKLELQWDTETSVYQLYSQRYKPDFFIKTDGELRVVEVKSGKPTEIKKAEICKAEMMQIYGINIELVYLNQIKEICLFLGQNFDKLISDWKAISIQNKGYAGSQNPYYGLKHTNKTIEVLRQKGKSRWESMPQEQRDKMLAGLLKGRDYQKKQKGINKKQRLFRICSFCGKQFEVIDNPNNKKSYCSIQCSSHKGAKIGNSKQSELKNERNFYIRTVALNWIESNNDIVMTCPLNKISTQLEPMLNLIPSQSSPKERLRMVCYAFDLISRKELLKYFQNYLIKKYAELKRNEV